MIERLEAAHEESEVEGEATTANQQANALAAFYEAKMRKEGDTKMRKARSYKQRERQPSEKRFTWEELRNALEGYATAESGRSGRDIC